MSPSKKTVLFVDDMPTLVNIMKDRLKDDFNIIGVSDGEEAWDHIEKDEIDFIVLDLEMPKMNGLEFLARLRSSENNTEVIITTGKSSRFYAEQCADLGVSGYIIKPYTGSEIRMRLFALQDRQEKECKKTASC